MWWSKVQDSFVNELFEYQLYLGNMVRSLFWPSGVYHKNTTLLTGHFSPERPVREGTSEFFCTRYRERAREARTRAPRGKRIADHLPSAWGAYKKKPPVKKGEVLITFPWKCHTRTTGFLARHQMTKRHWGDYSFLVIHWKETEKKNKWNTQYTHTPTHTHTHTGQTPPHHQRGFDQNFFSFMYLVFFCMWE